MKRFEKMNVFMVMTALSFSLGAIANVSTPDIRCSGVSATAQGKQNVWVRTNQSDNTLEVAIFPIGQSKPGTYETDEYPITKVIPMFPIYSVTAKVDRRPVDGALTVVNLNIRTEGISADGSGRMPASLIVTSTARLGTTKATYLVGCTIAR